ncbi:hypothetical protein [Candidatus Liberibacter solanacearum]|uniref:Uncharacterized protein n=1 Tax=Candidatus Liberibacter solanacearum TaxID=556287 RepID=A0A1V2N7F5_9HYPH|nr:hypothetical protein [Candidatus Liberibacter solanacearum]ONI58742.1 hypothetical protein AYO25_03945 [Candidatus Liberibacter solanacearum]ONI59390.1 hypothetical protein AYJ09_03385 [Candidatus Liberibacter solanacearum]
MRCRDSKTLHKLLSVQHCLKRIAEVNLAYTISQHKKINILREELIDSMYLIALKNPSLACHYSNFHHSLSENEKKMADLQSIQENKLLSEKVKIDRLTELKDEIYLLEERQYDDENNEDNVDQRVLFDAVSRKFITL